jgi:OOP family OmpA-OmpF porin
VSSRVDTLEQDQHALRAEVSEVKQTAQAALTQSQQLAQANILPKTAINHDVHFAFDDHRLTPEGKATLDALAADLAQQPYAYIQIIGHADGIGPETYNLDLARRRAEMVAAYLAQKPTVDRDKLRVLSLGKAIPVAENTTSKARAHNRRVEVRVYRLSWQ